MNIKELIDAGPSPRYRLRAIAVQYYREIEAARRLPRTWPEIATALGLPPERWPGLARAYRKVAQDFGGAPPCADVQANPSIVQKPDAKAVVSKNLKIDI